MYRGHSERSTSSPGEESRELERREKEPRLSADSSHVPRTETHHRCGPVQLDGARAAASHAALEAPLATVE